MVSVMSLLDMLKCAQHEHHHNGSAGVVRRRAFEHGLATTDDPDKCMQDKMDINSAKFQHTLAKVMLAYGTNSLDEAKRIAASHLGLICDSGSDTLRPHIKINTVDVASEEMYPDMSQAIGESRRAPMRACRVRAVSSRAGGAGPSSEVDLGNGVRPSNPNGIGSMQLATPAPSLGTTPERATSELGNMEPTCNMHTPRRTRSETDVDIIRAVPSLDDASDNTESIPDMHSPPKLGMAEVNVGGARNFTLPMGSNNGPKMQVSMPARYDPKKDNWIVWSNQVKRVMRIMGIAEASDPSARSRLSDQIRETAVTFLHEIMPKADSNLFVTRESVFPDEMWSAMERPYKSKDDFRRHATHRHFHTMKQESNEPVAQWIVRLSTVKSELAALGIDIPTTDHKLALIDRTLPTLSPGLGSLDHSAFFAELRQLSGSMTVQELEDRLISKAEAMREQLTVAGARAGVSNTLTFRPTGNNNRNNRFQPRAHQGGKPSAGSKGSVWCTTCNQVGHKCFSCPAKLMNCPHLPAFYAAREAIVSWMNANERGQKRTGGSTTATFQLNHN